MRNFVRVSSKLLFDEFLIITKKYRLIVPGREGHVGFVSLAPNLATEGMGEAHKQGSALPFRDPVPSVKGALANRGAPPPPLIIYLEGVISQGTSIIDNYFRKLGVFRI